jgi:hypothetical protein
MDLSEVYERLGDGLVPLLAEQLAPIRTKVEIFNTRLAELKTEIARCPIDSPATGTPFDAPVARANGSAHS